MKVIVHKKIYFSIKLLKHKENKKFTIKKSLK